MPAARTLSAAQVAELLGGELVGPGGVLLGDIRSLEEATPESLSLLASSRYLSCFQRSRAGAVVTTPEFKDVHPGPKTRILVDNPYEAIQRVGKLLCPEPEPSWGIAPGARIGQGTTWQGRIAIGAGAVLGRNVTLGRDCRIGPYAVVEDGVTMGDRCEIGACALIASEVTLGNEVKVGPGARIGTPGFGFFRTETGHQRVFHRGACHIADGVEIGANSTIDRGSLGSTSIGKGTKIDNLVHIAHNVRVGERCLIMAQVGIAGSTVVEDEVILAGQAGLADHLTVGRQARVAAQAGVIGNVEAGLTVSGYPARPHREVLRQTAALRRLSRMVDQLERLVSEQFHEPTS
ncbi:UDP-3-O-acylglucosamine N-acyltransferase [bacterium HR33]|nr:UDP-3-O-acylglucosamine N-acyltransferase [bacterium HR33]